VVIIIMRERVEEKEDASKEHENCSKEVTS